MGLDLTESARQAFAEEGYLIVRGAVGEEEVSRLRRAIASALANDDRLGAMPGAIGSSFCPSLCHEPSMWRWLEEPRPQAAVLGLLDGPYRPPARIQIALRFPEPLANAPDPAPHVDGVPTEHNGLPPGRLSRDTLVLGLFLSPLTSPDRGNLLVWPGSHLPLAAALAAPELEKGLQKGLKEEGPDLLLRVLGGLHLGGPIAIEAAPGDLILMHHLLAHAGGPNLSMRIREALYLRLLHVGDDPAGTEALIDPGRFFRRAAEPSSPCKDGSLPIFTDI